MKIGVSKTKLNLCKFCKVKLAFDSRPGGTFFFNKVDSSEVISKVYYYYTREKFSNIIE